MRRVRNILLVAFCLGILASIAAASAGSIAWNSGKDQVSADVHNEPLLPLLKDIAHQTGWHIFVEPGIHNTADVKFSDLPQGEALKKLLGDLNFAYVPQTNGPNHLYVFATTMQSATRPVKTAVTNAPGKHVANELLVKVKPGTDIDALARLLGAKVIGRQDKLGIYLLKFPNAAATLAALNYLKNNSDVATVDYNYIYNRPVTPKLLDGGGGSVAPISLQLNPPGNNGKVIVGLVDTAIQPLGKGLDKFILNPLSVAGSADPSSSSPTHATSMAETILRAIAAQGGSTSVQIQPVDVYGNQETATTWSLALGIEQAVNAGANPINLSLGSTTDSGILNQVIQQAEAKGIVFFAAAGNTPTSSPTYPAALTGVNSVAATQGSQLAPYSNYGAFSHMALPGASQVYFDGKVYTVQGTSPATAYATGIAAGTKSNSNMSWGQITTAMQNQFPMPSY